MKSMSRKELKLVHIIYRHGMSTPTSTYPNDPHQTHPLAPIGWGQITNKGKRNMYQHGLFLRQRYGEFLGNYYSPENYYVQTTDTDVAKMSAQCVNAGLWPPFGAQQWGTLHWQPIPIHTQPLDDDNLLLVKQPHPDYFIEHRRVLDTSDDVDKKFKENSELFERLTAHTGKKIKEFDDVEEVYRILMCQEAFGLELPSWTKEFYPERMEDAVSFSYMLKTYNETLNRRKGGLFIQKLINDWKNIIEESNGPNKAYLYVGHDATIVNILRALKLWKQQIPKFSINVFFELYYDHVCNQHCVDIFFRDVEAPFADPKRMIMGNEDRFCTLEKFINITKRVVPAAEASDRN